MRILRFLLTAIVLIGAVVLYTTAVNSAALEGLDCQQVALAACMGGAADDYCKRGGTSCCQDQVRITKVTGCHKNGSACAEDTKQFWTNCTGNSSKCETGTYYIGDCPQSTCVLKSDADPNNASCCTGSSPNPTPDPGDDDDEEDEKDSYTGYHDAYSGHVDRNMCYASGWLRQDQNLSKKLTYRVLVDGAEVHRDVADDYRSDLTGVCTGGTCAFNADLWGKFSFNADHSILVQGLRNDGGWFNLSNSPKTLRCQATNIQGRKVVVGVGEVSPAINQTITVSGVGSTTSNPYFFNNLPSGNYTITSSVPAGYRVGYSICYDQTGCHSSVQVWSNTVSVYADGGYIDLWWHYQPLQTQSYKVYAYTDIAPYVGKVSGAAFNFAWNGGGATSAGTGSNGWYTIPTRTDGSGTSNTLVLNVTQGPFTAGGMTYTFAGFNSVSGCAAPSGSGVSISGNRITITKSGNQDICIPLRFSRTPTNQNFGIAGMGFFVKPDGTTAGLQGIPLTFKLWENEKVTQQPTVLGNVNGAASRTFTHLNSTTARVGISVPATFTDASGRQFNFYRWTNGPFNYNLPADWSSWVNRTTTAPYSPQYWVSSGTVYLAAEYTEVPESFTGAVTVYYKDQNGAVQRLSGVQPTLVWDRTGEADTTVTLTTNANGYASDTRSFRTSMATVMRFTFPATVNINGNANRQATFVGFNYNPAISGCGMPSAEWNSSWTKNGRVVNSPQFFDGASRCIQAEYAEVPQNFSVIAHAFYNDLSTGVATSLKDVPVRVDWIRGNGETVSASNLKTGLLPITLSPNPALKAHTTTTFQVTYPTEFSSGQYIYVLRGFQAGAGGALDSGWTISPANVGRAGPFTYSTTRRITARYEAIPLPVVTFDPLSPGKYYWKANDLCPQTDANCKPLPFVTGTITDAYSPGTPAGTNTSTITIRLIAPTGQLFYEYEIPVVAQSTTGPGGYRAGRFMLTEAAVRTIEHGAPGGYLPSSCTQYPDRICFGTTVGQPGHFFAGASREDQAIGEWRFEATYTRTDPDGTTWTSDLAELIYEVVWHMQAQP